MDKFEEMTRDIGLELKKTAERIYRWAGIVAIFSALLPILLSAVVGDEPWLILVGLVCAAINYGVVLGVAHLITINLYAKGEMVHQLQTSNNSLPAQSPVTPNP